MRSTTIAILTVLMLVGTAMSCFAQRADELAFITGLADGTGELRIYSLSDKQTRRPAPGYDVKLFDFSPDGKRLAFVGRKAGEQSPAELWVLDLATGETKCVTSGLWGEGAPAWRPGAEQVAVGRSGGYRGEDYIHSDGGVWLVDLRTGAMQPLIGLTDADFAVVTKIRFTRDGSTAIIIRGGRYAAIQEVARPSRWYRLDIPALMNPAFLLDADWLGGTRSLLLAAATGTRSVCLPYGPGWTKAKGPGGIWRWDLTKSAPLTDPVRTSQDESRILLARNHDSQARLVSQKDKPIYALAVSHAADRAAFLNDTGVYTLSLRTGAVTKVNDVPRVRARIAAYLTEIDWPQIASVSWSPDDRYLLVAADRTSSVVEIGKRAEIASPWLGKSGMDSAWRPGVK